MKPSFGDEVNGSATSALIPHTTVVFPMRTSAEPLAVEIEPSQSQQGIRSKHERGVSLTNIDAHIPPICYLSAVWTKPFRDVLRQEVGWVKALEGGSIRGGIRC